MKRAMAILLIASTLPAADLAVSVSGDGIVEPEIKCSARAQAARMLKDIGVHTRWSGGPDAIEVRFTTGHKGNPGAVAFATPFASRAVVTVMYDRVVAMTDRRPDLRAALLAHVLVHELAHVLMRTNHHAASGVMKAQWSSHEVLRMQYHPLPFLKPDAEMIRRALAAD